MKYVRLLTLMALAIMSIAIFAFFNGTGRTVGVDIPATGIIMDIEAIASNVLAVSTAEIATDYANITDGITAIVHRAVSLTGNRTGGADIISCTLHYRA